MLKSFREQTYRNRRLLIWDTSTKEADLRDLPTMNDPPFIQCVRSAPLGFSIGTLRNYANQYASKDLSDIIAHWDSDDWSHPNRLAEQVELLTSPEIVSERQPGKLQYPEAVSYNEMLFWYTSPPDVKARYEGMISTFPKEAFPLPEHLRLRDREAWLYRSPNPLCPIGTSLCYWRSTWERHPFAERSMGEDLEWWSRVRGVMASSFVMRPDKRTAIPTHPAEPRMIAAIHGGNTVPKPINPDSREWKRVPEWDSYCRGVMA
jgi:glycosyltransferase involved in cell wall biosynthesis